MNNKTNTALSALGWTEGLKLAAIIAFWEGLIMAVFSKMVIHSPIVEALIDIIFLTFFSGLSIWYLIIRPERNRKQILDARTNHLIDQEIQAIDDISIITTSDVEGNILEVNDNFVKISGYSKQELLGHNHRIVNSGFHPKSFFEEMWKTLKSGKSWRGKIKNKAKDGTYYWVDSYIVPIFNHEGQLCKYVSFRFAITAEKIAEEALENEREKMVHMARLSAIGEMAGGIAHEINNPLAVINGTLYLTRRKLLSDQFVSEVPKIIESIDKIQNQVVRMSKIISGLRDFSRSGKGQTFEIVPISKILDSVKDLCAEKLKRLGIHYFVESEEFEFQCNFIQVEQVLVNLINNSIDAIANNDERWIKVVAKTNGKFVELILVDSGNGIPENVAKKIMQPFFTTKEVGKGTGLGLSISRGIIEKHGGTLSLNKESKNTCFEIVLPKNEQALMNLVTLEEAQNCQMMWHDAIVSIMVDKAKVNDDQRLILKEHCTFSKWIEKIEPRFKESLHFNELKSAKIEFDQQVDSIFKKAINGVLLDPKIKENALRDFDKVSEKFVDAHKQFCQTISESVIAPELLNKCS